MIFTVVFQPSNFYETGPWWYLQDHSPHENENRTTGVLTHDMFKVRPVDELVQMGAHSLHRFHRVVVPRDMRVLGLPRHHDSIVYTVHFFHREIPCMRFVQVGKHEHHFTRV